MAEGSKIRRIEPWLARGGQPVGDDYATLFDSGIRAVVNLRTRDETSRIEKHAPGLLSVRIPVRDHHAPSDAQAMKWLELCHATRENTPIYVHCHEGHGRTSVFCSLVRIAQKWTIERIIAEERTFGFDPDEEREQAEFIRRFADNVRNGHLDVPDLR